jgi:hypothetical protein
MNEERGVIFLSNFFPGGVIILHLCILKDLYSSRREGEE